MVDSSWKSRGNVSVHSANSWSSLGPNFRTWACKASQGSSACGEGCMGGGWSQRPLPQPQTVHVAARGSAAMVGGGGPLLPLSQETDGAWGLTTESRGGQTHVWNGGHLLLIIASHPISLSVVATSQFACGGPLSPISSWPYPRASGTSQTSAGQSGHGIGPQRGMLPKLSQRDQDLYWSPPPIGLGRADQDPGSAEAASHQAENLP